MTFWGIWGHFEDQLRTWGLRTLGTFCAFSWLFEDFLDTLRNFGRPEDLMLSEHWRTFQERLMTSCEPIEDLLPLRILRTFQDHLMTIWGTFDDLLRILRTLIYVLRTLRSPWIPFVDLWGLRGIWWPFEEFEDILRISWEPEVWGPWVPFVHFLDFLRTLWTFWGTFWRPEDLSALRTLKNRFRNDLMTSCEPIEDLMPLRNFQWLFEDHLMNIWANLWLPTEDFEARWLTFWGLWSRLEYLLWTYEDFEGFEALLRI